MSTQFKNSKHKTTHTYWNENRPIELYYSTWKEMSFSYKYEIRKFNHLKWLELVKKFKYLAEFKLRVSSTEHDRVDKDLGLFGSSNKGPTLE